MRECLDIGTISIQVPERKVRKRISPIKYLDGLISEHH